MQILQMILEDVKRGKNIDLYVAVPFAVCLVVLNITGAFQQRVDTLTLALLALLAIAMIGNRNKLEAILKARDELFLSQFPSNKLEAEIEKAAEVWLIGTHLDDIIRAYYPLFEKKLKRENYIRVLVLDPDGEACKMSAMRFSGGVDVEHERVLIQSTLERLCKLQKINPERLEIRTIDYLFSNEMILMNPGKANGWIYLTRYTFQVKGGPIKPKMIYSPGNVQWYNFILSEARNLWESGKQWKCR